METRDRPVIVRDVERLLGKWDQEGGDESWRERARQIVALVLGDEQVPDSS
jgi:hypothetical protein